MFFSGGSCFLNGVLTPVVIGTTSGTMTASFTGFLQHEKSYLYGLSATAQRWRSWDCRFGPSGSLASGLISQPGIWRPNGVLKLPNEVRLRDFSFAQATVSDRKSPSRYPRANGHKQSHWFHFSSHFGMSMNNFNPRAVIFYTMIKNQVEYDGTIWDARDAQREKPLQGKLKRQAKQLGYDLVPIEPQAA